jgi:hypothetical protein
MIAAESDVSRLTAGPPGIPADRLDHLRRIYQAALADPALLEEARKQELPIVPGTAEQTRTLILEALQQTPENVAMLAAAMKATP